MSYRVFIPTAGLGSRLKELTTTLNKSLVSINNKPVISHIIESFPVTVEYVIALGYKGNLVKEYLNLAHPERSFIFVDVSPFEGPGSSLGYTLKCASTYLQEPFIFNSCDTLVDEIIPSPNHNWVGCSLTEPCSSYRSVQSFNSKATRFFDKSEFKNPNCLPYIGLAGVSRHLPFWDAISAVSSDDLEQGEYLAHNILRNEQIAAHKFTWHDTGSLKNLSRQENQY